MDGKMLSAAFSNGDSKSGLEAPDIIPEEQHIEIYTDWSTDEMAHSSELSTTLTSMPEFDYEYLKSLPSPEYEGYQSGPEWDDNEQGFKVDYNTITEDSEIPIEEPKKAGRKRGKRDADKKNPKRQKCTVKHDEDVKPERRRRNGERTRLKSSAFLIH